MYVFSRELREDVEGELSDQLTADGYLVCSACEIALLGSEVHVDIDRPDPLPFCQDCAEELANGAIH